MLFEKGRCISKIKFEHVSNGQIVYFNFKYFSFKTCAFAGFAKHLRIAPEIKTYVNVTVTFTFLFSIAYEPEFGQGYSVEAGTARVSYTYSSDLVESPRGRRLHRPAAWRGYRSGHLGAACNLADVAFFGTSREMCHPPASAALLRQDCGGGKYLARRRSRLCGAAGVEQPDRRAGTGAGRCTFATKRSRSEADHGGRGALQRSHCAFAAVREDTEIVRTTGKDAAGSVSVGMASTLAYFLSGPFMKACKDALGTSSLSSSMKTAHPCERESGNAPWIWRSSSSRSPVPGLVRLELFRQRTFLLHTDESKRSVAELSLATVAQIP